MKDKQLISKIAQRKLIIFAVEPLHLDSSITRFIRSGSMCSIGCSGGNL